MKRKKILIVDDSKTILMAQRMILGKEPYDLIFASDGEEGIRKALSDKPDLILLDVVMPKLTGLDVCRLLRSEEATKDIPILLVTTRGEGENVEKGYAAGCNDYVTKPINSLELLTKVRNYLQAEE